MAQRKLEGVLTLKDQLSSKVQRPRQALRGLKGETDGLARSSGLLNTALTTLAAGGLAYVGQRAVNAVWDLGRLGARSKDVQRNLEAFAGGAEQAAKFAGAVGEAAGNTINRMDAAATASKFLQMGLATTTDEMELYIEGAIRLGDQTQSGGQRIGEMTQLLKNLNINMLDNFGLSRQVIMARTQELQATQDLTREQGMLQAIQEEITRQLGVLGPRAEDGALAIDQLDASLQDMKITLGEAVAPAVVEVSEAVVDATPKVAGAANQLVILSEAGLAWAAAAVSGQDATMAWENAILKSIGATRAVNEELDAWMVAEKGLESNLPGATAMIHDQAEAVQNLSLNLGAGAKMIRDYASKIVGLVPAEAKFAYETLQDEQRRLKEQMIRDAVLHRDAEVDAADTVADTWSSAYSDAQAAAQQFDNDVRGLFQFSMNVDTTSIMDRLGFHEDTWDEWMRRAADVMNQGAQSPWYQAMVDSFPKFQELLGQFGDPKAAAAVFIDQFQSGFVPEAINIDAIVKAYQKQLASEQAWEGIYQQAKDAIRAAGGGVDEGVLSQIMGGVSGGQMMGVLEGDVDDLGGAVGGVRGQMENLQSQATQALPAITRDTRLARDATKSWHDRLQEVIGDYQGILGLGFTVTVTEGSPPPGTTGGGGGGGGGGAGGGGASTTPTGPIITGGAGANSGVTIGSVQVSMDDSFRSGLARVGIHV